MTCRGQDGETYQIPIAPPPADHELITDYLNTFAGFHRVHRTGSGAVGFGDGDTVEEHGSLQYLRYSTGASTGPSVPPRVAGGAGQGMSVHSRGRDRRTHTEGSSWKPIPDDDESDEEAVSP
ncbi:hypothetical protein CsSME_00014745 [Camellia sinensis var. sinensis]